MTDTTLDTDGAGFDEDIDVFGDLPDGIDGADHDESGTTLALFEGDAGGLSLEQRRAFVALLKQRFVSARDYPTEWRVIRETPEPIRARLNDMFLDLHVDLLHEVAFKRQASTDSGNKEFPSLLRDTSYTREETLLLIFLRQRFQSEKNAGHDDVTVERDEILTHVASFRPAHAGNRTGDKTKTVNAVDRMVTAKILLKTNDSDRLRISPVIPVLLPLPRLRELLEWFMNENGTTPDNDETTDTDGEIVANESEASEEEGVFDVE